MQAGEEGEVLYGDHKVECRARRLFAVLGLRRLSMRGIAMNDEKIEIIYNDNELEQFRRDILAGNLCDIFLPVSFIQADGCIGSGYDMHGY